MRSRSAAQSLAVEDGHLMMRYAGLSKRSTGVANGASQRHEPTPRKRDA
jgi:hypothetical protein